MGRVNYREVNGLPDVQNAMDYELVFGAIPGSTNTNDLRISCQTAVLPGRQNQAIVVQLHGHDLKFSGKAELPKTIPITFVENATMSITKKLRTWLEMTRGSNSATSSGFKKNGNNPYAVDVKVLTFDTTGKQNLVAILRSCFPEDVPDVNLDGTNAQAMLVQATLSYDTVDYNIVTKR